MVSITTAVHALLDEREVPNEDKDGTLHLIGRIAWVLQKEQGQHYHIKLQAPYEACSFKEREASIAEDEPFHLGEIVQHRVTKMVGKVTDYERGSTDIIVDFTGPYPQKDFVRLVPSKP